MVMQKLLALLVGLPTQGENDVGSPRYFNANEAAPMPSKKLRWRIGLWHMCVLSSCWMRGISGGGVAAVPTPSCPYSPVLWAEVSTVGWLVGTVGSIGLVAGEESTVSVAATAAPVVSQGCSVVVGIGMGGLLYGCCW